MSKDATASLCRFFAAGFCAKGDQCVFQHKHCGEQPSNVHIPQGKREAYERAIRGLSSESPSPSPSGPATSQVTPTTPPPGTPPRTPTPEAVAHAGRSQQPQHAQRQIFEPRRQQTAPPPHHHHQQQHHHHQQQHHHHGDGETHAGQGWGEVRPTPADTARQEVIQYFEQFLLSTRRHTPGGVLERECVAVFEDYVHQLQMDGSPLYQGHAEWVERFNVYWGPNGAGVAKWLSHGILGNYLAGKLGFQWGDLQQEQHQMQERYAEQPTFHGQRHQRGPPYQHGNGSSPHHRHHPHPHHHQQHFPPPPPPPTASDNVRHSVEPDQWPPSRGPQGGRGQGQVANAGRLMQEQRQMQEHRMMQEQHQHRMIGGGGPLGLRPMQGTAPPGHTVALVVPTG
eukprot:Hpha_TRINITY_DN15761_c6_g12::TRINITY_DN15761_c6_g12_i1::g.38635::m.38635